MYKKEYYWLFTLTMVWLYCLSSTTGMAGDLIVGGVLCQVYSVVTGVFGKMISCLAVAFTCVGALFGKSSWSLVIVVIVAIGGTLGAHHVVSFIVEGMGEHIDIIEMCS